MSCSPHCKFQKITPVASPPMSYNQFAKPVTRASCLPDLSTSTVSLEDLWDIQHHGETRHASHAIYHALQTAGYITPDDTRLGGWSLTDEGEALLADAPLVSTGPRSDSNDYNPAPTKPDRVQQVCGLLFVVGLMLLAAWSIFSAVGVAAGFLAGWALTSPVKPDA